MKKSFVVILTFLFFSSLFAQQKSILEKSTVHLFNIEQKNKIKSTTPDGDSKLFNYNPIIPSTFFTNKNVINKNLVSDESSVFLVFSSTSDTETNIMEMSSGNTKIIFSNKKIRKDKDLNYKNVDANNGIILSYLFNLESTKRNNYISFKDYLETSNTKGNSLLEMIYIPAFITKIERKEIETYLSIKYGISLLGMEDYLSSNEIKIWDAEANKQFNYRVTGIGRDNQFNLYQKQSINSTLEGPIIALNKLAESNSMNLGEIPDRNFIVWGDNNKLCSFSTNQDNVIEKCSRTWKVQSTKTIIIPIETQIIINPQKLFTDYKLTEGKSLWMVSQDSLVDSINMGLSQGKQDGDLIVFNHVNFDGSNLGSSYFSFIQAPDFFALLAIDKADCKCIDKGNVNLKLIGGTAPYSVIIEGNYFKTESLDDKNQFILKNIPSGNYKITIKDSKNKEYSSEFSIIPDNKNAINIAKHWMLDNNGTALIVPSVDLNSGDLNYEWYFGNKLISTDSIFLAKNPGAYNLKVTNNNGCTANYQFEVHKDFSSDEGIQVYPNPVLISGVFNIKIDLPEKSNINIEIVDVNGKTLRSISGGIVKHFEYSDQLTIPGTYLICIKMNNRNYWHKIIVV